MIKPLTIEEQKVVLKEEMERVRRDIFIFGTQMKFYANKSSTEAHSQRNLGVAAQLKGVIDEKTEYYEQLETDLKALE